MGFGDTCSAEAPLRYVLRTALDERQIQVRVEVLASAISHSVPNQPIEPVGHTCVGYSSALIADVRMLQRLGRLLPLCLALAPAFLTGAFFAGATPTTNVSTLSSLVALVAAFVAAAFFAVVAFDAVFLTGAFFFDLAVPGDFGADFFAAADLAPAKGADSVSAGRRGAPVPSTLA